MTMTNLSLQARQFKVIKESRDHHNRTCPLGPAIEVHLNPFDISRLEWEEGDIIATLILVGNPKVPTDRLRILCAGDVEAEMAKNELPVALPQPDIVVVPDFLPEKERQLVHASGCCGLA